MLVRRLVCMAAVIGLVWGSGASYAQKRTETAYYEVSLEAPTGNMGTRKAWRKGSDFRWEMLSGDLKITSIKNKDGVFIIHPGNRFIGKYPPGTLRESLMSYLPGPAGDVKAFLAHQEAKQVGTESVGEVSCTLYEYVEKDTGWKCKLWVDKKTNKPVKLFLQGTKKDDNVTAKYREFRTGGFVSDSKFKLPEGVEIRQIQEPKRDSKEESPKSPDEKQGDGDKPKPEETDRKEIEGTEKPQ